MVRSLKILADMCDAGVLMKVGATSSLKYVLQKNDQLVKSVQR